MVTVWYRGQIDPEKLEETHDKVTGRPETYAIELGEHKLSSGTTTGHSHGAGATLHNEDYPAVVDFFRKRYGDGDGLQIYLQHQTIDSKSLPASRILLCRAHVFRKKGRI